MKLKQLWAVALLRLVRQLAARRGYVLLPITEIECMESDAESYYLAMKRKPYVTKSAKAYFNGVADYSSKSAHRLREKYLPNSGITGATASGASQSSNRRPCSLNFRKP